MMAKQIGIVTIGQSPRSDVVPDMTGHLGDGVTVVERGALDDLDSAAIREFAPDEGMLTLVTRLRDGTEVEVGKEKLLPRLDRVIADLDGQAMDLILLLCNGDFPDFDTRTMVVEPQRVVDHALAALVRPRYHLGVLVPAQDQEAWVTERLSTAHPRLTAATASPYEGADGLEAACAKFNTLGCDLVVLYCMGYNQQIGAKVRRLFPGPVMVSSSIVARTLGELVQ